MFPNSIWITDHYDTFPFFQKLTATSLIGHPHPTYVDGISFPDALICNKTNLWRGLVFDLSESAIRYCSNLDTNHTNVCNDSLSIFFNKICDCTRMPYQGIEFFFVVHDAIHGFELNSLVAINPLRQIAMSNHLPLPSFELP